MIKKITTLTADDGSKWEIYEDVGIRKYFLKPEDV